jgi:multidrug efflux pump subunit AcrA (membrane-fusion protein)
MARESLTLWTCLCARENSFDTEVCPACGRQRDFVLRKQETEEEVSQPSSWSPDPTRNWRLPGQKRADRLQGVRTLVGKIRGVGGEGPPVWASLRDRHPRLLRWVVTLILLAVIYKATLIIVDYVTQPKLEMLTSPLAGAVAVVATPAEVRSISRAVTYTGTISPWQEVTVYPRVEGWLNTFSLYEGDQIKEGEVIAKLDRVELGAMVDQNRAALSATEQERLSVQANINAIKAAVVAAKADKERVQADLDFWVKEHRRIEQLFKSGAISEFELDNARKNYAGAKARLAEQEAKIALQEAKLQEMESRLRQVGDTIQKMRAELTRTRTVYNYTDIVAPFTGQITKRHVYGGILLKPGMPIVEVADMRKVRIQVKVAEEDIPYMQEGMTEAVIRIPSLPGPHQEYRATVSKVFPRLDPLTRTTTVEMVVENPEEQIKADMYAIVDLILEKRENVVVIPSRAVVEVEGKPTVYTLDISYAKANEVELGIRSGDRVEIRSGIQEGDMVIYKGNRGLVDGQEVALVEDLY